MFPYKVARCAIYEWERLEKQTGTLVPLPRKQATLLTEEKVRAHIKAHPDATLKEIVETEKKR